MKVIQVLGTGCAGCTKTVAVIEAVAVEIGSEVRVEKVTDPAEIMRFQVMQTPAVVMDDKVVHCGSIPSQANIKTWLVAS